MFICISVGIAREETLQKTGIYIKLIIQPAVPYKRSYLIVSPTTFGSSLTSSTL